MSPTSSLQPPASRTLLDNFRHNRTRGLNDDINLTLRPAFRDLLGKLGNPQNKLPPVFHVAGTNGKGSVCAFLRAMLEAAGYRVHVYTSPHLVRFHERIRIAGRLISEAELVELLSTCLLFSEPNSVTYFEAATAVAFTAFARHPADFTILEVGLGGRLDATNIIPKSIASIITRLSFDHRDYLGDTIADIAREKAGIMREGIPCFAAAQPPAFAGAGSAEALPVLRAEAKKAGTPLFVADEDWRVEKTSGGFQFAKFSLPPRGEGRGGGSTSGVTSDARSCENNSSPSLPPRGKEFVLNLPQPALLGEHQYGNAGLAIAALLGAQKAGHAARVTADAIAAGLQKAEWPARLQRLAHGNLARLLPPGSELWLDGGHNDSAGEVLAQQAEAWKKTDDLPLYLICGMLTSKQPLEFLTPLHVFAAGIHTVPVPDEGTFSPENLATAAQMAGIRKAQAAPDIETAINSAVEASRGPKRILICGSLYLAGQVLEKNGNT